MERKRFRKCLCVIFVILLFASCFRNTPLQPQPSLSQHQIKLTFRPDDGMTYLTSQDIDKFYSSAQSTGMELGYRTIRFDQERGQIKFMREGVGNSYLINLEVIVSITDGRQTAYIHIKTSSVSEAAAQSAAREYRNKYILKMSN